MAKSTKSKTKRKARKSKLDKPRSPVNIGKPERARLGYFLQPMYSKYGLLIRILRSRYAQSDAR